MTDTPTRTTRAQRMAMPLAREVVKDLAVEHGACIRPIQLRRTNLDTGEADTVLVPCGHTLAHVCRSCAERARTLRAAQCREGWHLEDEPDIDPDPATEDQRFWVEKRAEAQQLRDQTLRAGAREAHLLRVTPRARRARRSLAAVRRRAGAVARGWPPRRRPVSVPAVVSPQPRAPSAARGVARTAARLRRVR